MRQELGQIYELTSQNKDSEISTSSDFREFIRHNEIVDKTHYIYSKICFEVNQGMFFCDPEDLESH